MNILDLNDDIMSKVKHNIFLRKITKHKEDNFNYEKMDWDKWESKNDLDFIPLDNGDWGCSYPPDFVNETYDLKVLVFEAEFLGMIKNLYKSFLYFYRS
eukprot:SAG11_NODE_330_length_10677_cov_8.535117_12_plen_99_part_00